ncbi:MAG TPA: anthranilate synthase component I, partial [Rhodospirillales bacterium]|nr:anthranilate synthase component I [Rhodospirillales bacterium]
MKAFPDFQDFEKVYPQRSQVMWTTLVADLETPVSAMLKLAGDTPNSFLLESVEGGATRGRYSFIGLRPDLIWRYFGDRAEINRRALHEDDAFTPCEE